MVDSDLNSAPSLPTAVIVQARMGASRLPGKPLKTVLGKPLLYYLIERLKRCVLIDKIAIATSDLPQDRPIAEFAKKAGVELVLGDEENVLSRFWKAARQLKAEVIVRITADCPLTDPAIVDLMVSKFSSLDYLSNTLIRTYPRGLDVEVFSKKALEQAFLSAKTPYEKEHVTPYIYRHPELFRIENVAFESDFSKYRWTVDTEEDFELIRRMLEALYPVNPIFSFLDMLHLMKKHPSLEEINKDVIQKP